MPARTLNLRIRLLLFAVFTAAAPIVLAQSTPAPDSATPPSFEVATIKPTDESPGVMHMTSPQVFPGGRIIINAHDLKSLICIAFHTGYWQISGGEGWMEKTRFDIEAKPSEEWAKKITNISHSNLYIEDENIRRMLQALLIERFQLKVHMETKTGKIYLLEQSSSGAKLPPTKATATEHPGVPQGYGGEIGRNGIYNASMPQLAKFAADAFYHQPVIDRTGLTGSFDYKRKVAVPYPPAENGAPVDMQEFTDNFEQLIREMGLKLISSTGPVETLVIDHAEKPSPN